MSSALRIILVLAGLVVLSDLGLSWQHPDAELDRVPRPLLDTGTAFGLLLLGGWLAGRLVKIWGLPKITGYLLFGVAIGPDALGLVGKDVLPYLRLVDDLAISLIALAAGSEIRLEFLRGSLRKILTVLGVQMALLVLLMGALVALITPALGWAGWDEPGTVISAALLVATVAACSSPAVVIAVISELHARGPLAQLILAVTVSKDLLVVVLFAAASAVVGAILGSGSDGGAGAVATDVAIHLGGSLVAGVIAGLLMALYIARVGTRLPVFLVLSGFGLALLSERLHLEPLVVALVAGMLMANVWSDLSETFFETVEDLSLPVYCVFFAVAGAKVSLEALQEMWVWALLLALARAAIVFASTFVGAQLAGLRGKVRTWLWSGFVSRAGVSIALAGLVGEQLAGTGFGDEAFNLVLATIALDELIGPLLLKLGLVRGGATAPDAGDEEPDPPGSGDGDDQEQSGARSDRYENGSSETGTDAHDR